MTKKKNMTIEETSIEAVTSGGGALVGMIIGGTVGGSVGAALGSYWGAVVTPIMTNFAKTILVPRQLERMELVYELGKEKFQDIVEKGSSPRKDMSEEKFAEFAEGVLLEAKDSYEEKKIPLLATLVAHAPFTNTPIDNLLQTLHEAERLSYRQLCLLSIIDNNSFPISREKLALSKKPFRDEEQKHFNELAEGVYQDLNLMIVDGIIAMTADGSSMMIAAGTQFVAPYNLRLLYPGRLLVNGLELGNISKEEIDPLIGVLREFEGKKIK